MSETKQSHSFNGWHRLRTLCVAMRQTEEKVQKLKEDIETKLKITQKIRDKRADVQASQVSIQSLETQLEWRKGKVRTLSARLSRQRRNFGERDAKLFHYRKDFDENRHRLFDIQRNYVAKREKLIWTAAQLFMRRKQLIEDVVFIFTVDERRDSAIKSPPCSCKSYFKISTVHLPDAESYVGHNEAELSVGLSYVCHCLDICSRIFDIPLRYSVHFFGSKSTIDDKIDPNIPQTKFPLFCRGQDKMAFQYGIFLLNKNIAQFRCDCGMNTQDLRCTLVNLRSLLDYLCGAKIEPFITRPLKFSTVTCQSPAPSGNSLESNDSELYNRKRERVGSYAAICTSNFLHNSSSTLRQASSLDFSKSGIFPQNSNLLFGADLGENHSDVTSIMSGWTTDACIEHSRRILQTCYFNADEFVDDDDSKDQNTKSNFPIVNGDFLKSSA